MDISQAHKSSSPFAKGGSRGILLRGRLIEDHRSIFTLRAKLNHTTSIAGGFLNWTKPRLSLSSDFRRLTSDVLSFYLQFAIRNHLPLLHAPCSMPIKKADPLRDPPRVYLDVGLG